MSDGAPAAAVTSKLAITRRFALLSSANLVGAGLSFVALVAIARGDGAAALGQVSLAFTILNYALITTSLGTEAYAVKTAAAQPDSVATLWPTVVLLRTLLAVPIYLLVIVLCLLLPEVVAECKVIIVMSAAIFANAVHPLWLPQAQEKMKAVATCNVAGQAFNLGFVLLAVMLHTEVWVYAASKLVADSLVAAGLVLWMRSTVGKLDWRAGLRDLRALARQTAPLGISNQLRTLSLGSDIVILSFFVAADSLGHFAAAHRIFTFLLSIGTMFFIVMLPILARRAQEGAGPLRGELRVSLRLAIPPVVLGMLILGAAAQPILALGFGGEFATAATSLQWLALALVANYAQRAYAQTLIAQGRQRTEMKMTTIAAVVHVLAKLGLVPLFGIAGAAAGTALGETVLLLLQRRAVLRAPRTAP